MTTLKTRRTLALIDQLIDGPLEARAEASELRSWGPPVLGDLVAKVLEAHRAHAAMVAAPPKDWEAELKLKAQRFAQLYVETSGVGNKLANVIAECAREWRAEAPAKNDLSSFFGKLTGAKR